MRARMGAGADTIIVAYVGRIAAEKGLDDILAAGRSIETTRTDVRFVFAGDGPYMHRCLAAAPQASCFMGRLEGAELAAFYASADVFVFPSVTDTFANVLLEAMASGLPVIAADAPATREVLGGAGEFYAGGSAYGLATSLSKLSTCAARREALARSSLSRSRDFRWNAVFDSLMQQYALVQRSHRAVSLSGKGSSNAAFAGSMSS